MSQMNTLIRIRPLTREKADAVIKAKRWTLAEATDAAYDALMKAEGISIADDADTRTGANALTTPAA